MSGQPGQAADVVKIRLSGAAEDVEALADVLSASPTAEIIDRSAPYPNRRDPGERVYLTLRIKEEPQR